jgi:hypothetical protein
LWEYLDLWYNGYEDGLRAYNLMPTPLPQLRLIINNHRSCFPLRQMYRCLVYNAEPPGESQEVLFFSVPEAQHDRSEEPIYVRSRFVS